MARPTIQPSRNVDTSYPETESPQPQTIYKCTAKYLGQPPCLIVSTTESFWNGLLESVGRACSIHGCLSDKQSMPRPCPGVGDGDRKNLQVTGSHPGAEGASIRVDVEGFWFLINKFNICIYTHICRCENAICPYMWTTMATCFAFDKAKRWWRGLGRRTTKPQNPKTPKPH